MRQACVIGHLYCSIRTASSYSYLNPHRYLASRAAELTPAISIGHYRLGYMSGDVAEGGMGAINPHPLVAVRAVAHEHRQGLGVVTVPQARPANRIGMIEIIDLWTEGAGFAGMQEPVDQEF